MPYDAIVLGLGGMGSATASALARRGLRVLGLEQFRRGHDAGSSHGQTRIIRTAYYEHPDYVPWCREAFGLWHDLEQRRGQHLLTMCPCLSLGPPESELVQGVHRAAEEHGLAIDSLNAEELRRRFPAFRVPDRWTGIVEQAAGYLLVDDAVRAMQDDARSHGAELRFDEPVRSWSATRSAVTVTTAQGTYSAARLIIAAGPWAASVLHELKLPLTVMRQVPMWFRPEMPTAFRRDRFPIFIAEAENGHYYGLPMIDSVGVKIARHYGADELATADAVDRHVNDNDEAPVREFIRSHLPDADGPLAKSSICLYTLSPDRHFIVDRHPVHSQVVIAAGFSGHGFKFAPVVGETLADLATGEKMSRPVSRFAIHRLM